jgi:hypothetical protein
MFSRWANNEFLFFGYKQKSHHCLNKTSTPHYFVVCYFVFNRNASVNPPHANQHNNLDMSLASAQVIATSRPPVLFRSTSSVPLTEFTSFPQLAIELRLSIWNMAIVPSIIRFEPGGGKGPGILFANRESREESRKHYRLCINMTPPQSYYPIHFDPFGVFINYEVDIVHITPMVYAVDPINYHGRDEPGYLNQNAVEHATTDFHRWLRPVRNIIFDVEDFRNLPEGSDEQHLLVSIIQLSQLCPTLNKIILVPKSSYELRYHEMNPNSAPSEVD